MPLHRTLPALIVLVLVTAIVLPCPGMAGDGATPFADYRTESWFLPQSPSVLASPAAALFNPAAWAINDKVGSDSWAILTSDEFKNEFQGGSSFGRNLGFAWQTRVFNEAGEDFRIYDYLFGLAGGGPDGSFGLSYRWSQGDTERIPRQKALAMGFISRPNRWLTYGSSHIRSLESAAHQSVFDVGVRPFGRQWLSLFADWTVNHDQAFFADGMWGAGAELRPTKGVHLGCRVREQIGASDLQYSLFLGLTFEGNQFSGQPLYDNDGELVNTTILNRATHSIPGLSIPVLQFGGKKNRYYPINLENRVLTYQKFRYFDNVRVAWLDLLDVLNQLRDDKEIDGVVLNLAGFRGRPSLIWEMRVKLEEIKKSGKEIIVHIDRPGATVYYLATAADRISMDPWGNVSLPGFALSRSYLQGTLEKLGIGFQEFRYFKYKSAAETFSRTDMSEADREQRQRIVDVIYEQLRDGVATGRGLTNQKFDSIVDELAILGSEEALEAGLIDVTTRWDELPKWLGEERDAKLISPLLKQLGRKYYDQEWGQPLRIPVVFAVGSCSMETGIRGRATSAYLRKLVKDPNVAAVVLRADSPGGDILPSDLVADAIRQLKKAGKPVIISQGDVAASGGYWISMDGSKVLTTPLTITGSIGVIGGWVWDDGLAASAGITSDAVHRGRHADLMTQVQFPLVGGLPRRPMDEQELARVKKVIIENYDDFVAAVANGREMTPEDVGEIAQGRVWMGGDAIANGLCDRYGTLDEAIQLARELAGIPDWRQTEVVEYPPRIGFAMPSFFPRLPSLLGLDSATDEWQVGAASMAAMNADLLRQMSGLGLSPGEVEYLRSIGSSPGKPLFMVSPDVLPAGWADCFPVH
ncbi:MAG: S49 family peptidase [Gemmatimonadales bacterium]|nr:S49 family peptidase [Gemmatimonadales bacterium]